jgi:hypothetical protein
MNNEMKNSIALDTTTTELTISPTTDSEEETSRKVRRRPNLGVMFCLLFQTENESLAREKLNGTGQGSANGAKAMDSNAWLFYTQLYSLYFSIALIY